MPWKHGVSLGNAWGGWTHVSYFVQKRSKKKGFSAKSILTPNDEKRSSEI